MADLNAVIRAWAAKREGVPQTHVAEVEFDYDAGWEGTDVTPGDPGKVIIRYTYVKSELINYSIEDIQNFISELAVEIPTIPSNVRVRMPKTDLWDAAKGLVLQLKKDEAHLSAESRIARMMLERALEID